MGWMSRDMRRDSMRHIAEINENVRRRDFLKALPADLQTARTRELAQRAQHPLYNLEERKEIDKLQRKVERRTQRGDVSAVQ